MPNTYCPCPRPILKKQCTTKHPSEATASTSTSPRDESAQLLDIDPSVLQSLVRFPPTPGLCRTFVADSPSIYDRSPIVVTPNKCKLPERGCPGRTYLPGDEATSSPSGSKTHKSIDAAGRHLHPRAVRLQMLRDDVDDELTSRMAGLGGGRGNSMPALIPDFSSSSESDESDGFSSPPLECASMTSPLSSKATSSPPGLSIPAQEAALYLGPISNPNTPLPFRSRTFASFSRFSSHPAPSRSHSPCRDGAPSTSPTRRRRSHSKQRRSRQCAGSPVSPSELESRYKSFSERSALSGCSLDTSDVGCLGGF